MEDDQLLEYMMENWIDEHTGQMYQYQDENSSWNNETGQFMVEHDNNCCSPTQNIAFCFQSACRRKVMTAEELEKFLKRSFYIGPGRKS